MMIRRQKIPFENQMSRTQTILGWIYLPIHLLVLPLLLSLYAEFSPTPMTEAQVNLIYEGLGVLFVLCAMLRYLRRSFDALADRPLFCLMTALAALAVDYALSYALVLLLLLVGDAAVENLNNEAIMDAAQGSMGMMKAVTIFLAPVVEEVLFRGVVFGSIRQKSRAWAYVASVALFAFAHVWQYALMYQNPALLLMALQYVPVAVALIWCYERSGSIWTPIFFHMGINAFSFQALALLEGLT